MSKPTRVAALYLAVVFLAGAVFGVVADRLYERTARASGPGPKDYRGRYVAALDKALALTPEQRTQVVIILDQTGDRFREVRERMAPEIDAIRQSQRQQIRVLLSAEQQARYQEFLEEQSKRHDKSHGR